MGDWWLWKCFARAVEPKFLQLGQLWVQVRYITFRSSRDHKTRVIASLFYHRTENECRIAFLHVQVVIFFCDLSILTQKKLLQHVAHFRRLQCFVILIELKFFGQLYKVARQNYLKQLKLKQNFVKIWNKKDNNWKNLFNANLKYVGGLVTQLKLTQNTQDYNVKYGQSHANSPNVWDTHFYSFD